MFLQGGHNRHSIRRKEYDYSEPGFYFVTICVKNKACIFGEVVENEDKFAGPKIKLSLLGRIVKNVWSKIPSHFQNAELDELVIMPNHLHAIIVIKKTPGATARVAPTDGKFVGAGLAPARMQIKRLGDIIGSFKSICTNEWLRYIKENNINETAKFWQRNYYERIIRNEKELTKIRNYIIDNPRKWQDDPENPNKIKSKSLPKR